MRVAVVVPRYGADVVGGAETLARGFAEACVGRGWYVEVWTSCARSHYTWENVHPAGSEESGGVLVRRFPVAFWDADRFAEVNWRLIGTGTISTADQYTWLESGAHAPGLYGHMARHADEFDVVVALPYALPLVSYAAWAAPGRVILWPCLHDEPNAYMEPARLLLERVWGVMFLSPEERDLAVERLGVRLRHAGVVGGGVSSSVGPPDRPPAAGNDLLYLGRLEEGKGLSRLYDYVRRYADQGGDTQLVVLGRGPLTPPQHPALHYRGFVSEAERNSAYASALAVCQPSLNESFSLTIMEGWLAARPALVHGECAVTRGHVRRSRGGLWFRTYEEFAGAVAWLQTHPRQASRMGRNGRRYVLSNYSWDRVVDRFAGLVRRWRAGDG